MCRPLKLIEFIKAPRNSESPPRSQLSASPFVQNDITSRYASSLQKIENFEKQAKKENQKRIVKQSQA